MVKFLYVTLFCLSLACVLPAQTIDTLVYSHQLVRSVGVTFPSLNYPLLSPLNHSGYGLAFHSTRFHEKANYLNQFQTHLELGLLYNNANDSYITSLGFRGDWSRHWHVTDRSRAFRLLCGASFNGGIDIYLKEDNTNNPLAYFFSLSISPSMLAKYRFNIGKMTIDLGQQFDVPIGSLTSSSEYSTMLPHAFIEEDVSFFDALQLVSLGSYRKYVGITTVDIIPSLGKKKKWSSFRISYILTGMNYEQPDFMIRSVDHIIMVGAIFHLFR